MCFSVCGYVLVMNRRGQERRSTRSIDPAYGWIGHTYTFRLRDHGLRVAYPCSGQTEGSAEA